MNPKSDFLTLRYGTSRGRDTYGYNLVTATSTHTGRKYRCSGAGYDVVAEPAPDTRDCPGNPLEIDVWTVALEAWSDGTDRVGLPAGVYVVPDELPADTLAHIVEACAQDWHDCHSPGARLAERDDLEREE